MDEDERQRRLIIGMVLGVCAFGAIWSLIYITHPRDDTGGSLGSPFYERCFPLIVEDENGNPVEGATVYFGEDHPENWDTTWRVQAIEQTDNAGRVKGVILVENCFAVAVKDNISGSSWLRENGYKIEVWFDDVEPGEISGYIYWMGTDWDNVAHITIEEPIPWGSK